MKKIFVLVASLVLVGCAPKSTPESEVLLSEIHATQSKTKVGINYMDYSKVAQELQIKLDDFERSKESKKIKYAGNLVATAESYVKAANKESGEDWSPHYHWEQAGWSYEYMQNCQTKGDNCYKFDEQSELTMDLITRSTKEAQKFLDALNK